jgi:hypothetical protein
MRRPESHNAVNEKRLLPLEPPKQVEFCDNASLAVTDEYDGRILSALIQRTDKAIEIVDHEGIERRLPDTGIVLK